MSIAALVKTLLEAGVGHDVVVAAVAAVEARPVDEQADRRRAADRERKRIKAEAMRNSAESAESADAMEGKESSPHTPLKQTSLTIPPSPPTGAQTPKGVRHSGSALPDDWAPLPTDADYAASQGLTSDEFASVCEEFRDWAAANRNRPIGRKADWPATLRGFVRRFAERKARAGPRQRAFGNRWDDIKRQLGDT